MITKTIPLSEFQIDNKYLAHPPDETLIEHSNQTLKYFEQISTDKNLDAIINKLIKKIDEENSELIKEMFVNAIFLHDVGKKNPCFQAKKMNNNLFDKYKESTKSSNHSEFSANQYLEYFLKLINNSGCKRLTRYKLQLILYSFSYQIAKHHGFLGNFWMYKTEDKNVKNYQNYIDKIDIPFMELFILNKLLFSLLISSDYYATTSYMSKLNFNDFGLFDNSMLNKFKENFTKHLSLFPKPEGINILRKEIFNESEKNLLNNLNKNIFYLEAPTGSGKTTTLINLALNLLEKNKNLNKLFYVFPFNTLVEQTKQVFNEIMSDEIPFTVINSITPINQNNQENNETDYTKSYIERLFFHSPVILTTHVSFFNIMFGTSKNDNFPLWQFANSVIIIDEIQSYRNELWWYMVEFFDKYAEYLNMKIIIMSATLPKLDYFLENKNEFAGLLSEQKVKEFYLNPHFKDRVSINYDLLNLGKINMDDLLVFFKEHKKSYKKILFEFIKKQTAREFYNLLKSEFENVYELTGDDNKVYRNFVIEKTKEDKPVIIVATQVIEAGVDIDMDLGFKDISTIDSEEQFMGRINRSCKKQDAKVYFFDLDEKKEIYKNDYRIEFNLKDEKYRKILADKNYQSYFKDVLRRIKEKGLKFEKGLHTNMDYFTDNIKKMNYKEISKLMTLINSENFTLFFPLKIDISKYKNIPEFNDENIENFLINNCLDGMKVWEYYISLSETENFSEYKVKKSYINSLMQFFTFNLIKYDNQSRPCIGEEINGIYFIEDYEEFIIDGKFDRLAFQEKCNSLFL